MRWRHVCSRACARSRHKIESATDAVGANISVERKVMISSLFAIGMSLSFTNLKLLRSVLTLILDASVCSTPPPPPPLPQAPTPPEPPVYALLLPCRHVVVSAGVAHGFAQHSLAVVLSRDFRFRHDGAVLKRSREEMLVTKSPS